jgi:hypothetical protein
MSKILGPNIGYIDILDKQVHAEIAKERVAPGFPLRPSSAGECARKLGYLLSAYKGESQYLFEEPKPDLHRLFKLGHAIEADLIKLLKQVPDYTVRYEQQVVSFFPLESGRWIEGSIDLVIWSDSYKAVGDVKSKAQKFSSFANSDWSATDEKLERMSSVERINDRLFWINDLEAFLTELHDPYLANNFYQLNMYANSQFIKERGIDHAFIVQYGKNNSQLREIRFRPNAKIYEQTVAKFKQVATAPIAELAREFPLGSNKCGYCEYAAVCRPDADSLKAYFDTWPQKDWPHDSFKIADGVIIDALFTEMQEAMNQGTKAQYLEGQICSLLEKEQIRKVKINNGQVWELRALKTGLVMRRTKL